MSAPHIGRYEILGELGRGGMATVYHARDPHFERHVAIKVLPREFLHDPQFRARFEREAKVIAALEDLHIVSVYDFGEEQGQPYLVMRYMPGGSLADRLRDGPLSLPETIRILSQLASALDEAHKHGVIHRDLKPGNILFDQRNNAFLSDFGIAKLVEATASLTGGGIVGTPAYMSPEQIHGNRGVDWRSDLYSLGIILFQMLAGQTPYLAETPPKLMMMHILDPVPSILAARTDLPPGVEGVIQRTMAKDADQRYQSATDMVQMLERAAAGEAIAAPAISRQPMPVATMVEAPQVSMPEEPLADARTERIEALDEATIREPLPEPTRRESPIAPPSIKLTESRRAPSTSPASNISAIPPIPWWSWLILAVLVGLPLYVVGFSAGILPPYGPALPTAAEWIEEAAMEPTEAEQAALEPTEAPIATEEVTVAPEATAEATLPPTEAPSIFWLAESGTISSNDEWTPYIEDFDGVPMALVPLGCFRMGSNHGDPNEEPVHDVCFEKPYWIDMYEVTNTQYGSTGSDWPSCSSGDYQPRNCIDWYDSVAHCEVRGARLPTEAEWEYAARGPGGLLYPWGDAFEGSNLIWNTNQPTDVGSKPQGASWIGALDMSGNVSEWVNDWYGDYPSGRQINPRGPSNGEYRVTRGGAWSDEGSINLHGPSRSIRRPSDPSAGIGFRCARDYEP